MAFILASESPRRRELLARLGVPFEIHTLPVDEFRQGDLPPAELPVRNAELKAASVAAKYPESLVLGADTVIVFEDRIIGKPADAAAAKRTLLELAGKTHCVVTGLALLRNCDGTRITWSECTRVTFKAYSAAVVDEYMRLVNVLDKAGSYALQEHGDMLVERVDGDPDNVVGLPLGRLKRELAGLGRAGKPD